MNGTTDPIPLLIMLVFHDKDHVEPRQDRCLEVDILRRDPSATGAPHRTGQLTSPGLRPSSYRPHTGFAAASTLVREFSTVVMPAFAMEIVCCSIASWMATRSSSRILSNSSMQTTPVSARTIAPPSR
ncbi:hypothetical protein A0H81_00483 [Grifola frondosa]|uniref:Uncharacterized protein n=1 Tax=Grifola frondosa TaxID=5627 RepID=A0A1C7MTY1_GRIFR|nr:hypothetical protein A0H81_00483 [Grifola frondosa]